MKELQGLVSFIVPVFNGEKYIEKCVQSILNQTYRHIEVIIINDGSTDRTFEICNALTKKDSRIENLYQKNSGPSAARNLGLNHARGEFIAFVDADDYISDNYIEYLLNFMKKYDADISSCGWMDVDVQGNRISRSDQFIEEVFSLKKLSKINIHIPYTVWHVLFKNSLRFKVNNTINFDEDIFYQEDLLFNYKMLLQAKKIVNTSEPLYYRVIHEANISKQSWSSNWFNRWYTIVFAQERICCLLEDYPVLYGNAIYNLILETAKIYALMKKHNVQDEEKIKHVKSILKGYLKKVLSFTNPIKTKFFAVCCCIFPIQYCRLRRYKLR